MTNNTNKETIAKVYALLHTAKHRLSQDNKLSEREKLIKWDILRAIHTLNPSFKSIPKKPI